MHREALSGILRHCNEHGLPELCDRKHVQEANRDLLAGIDDYGELIFSVPAAGTDEPVLMVKLLLC